MVYEIVSPLFLLCQGVLLIILCSICIETDLRYRKIKNPIVFTTIFLGLLLHAIAGSIAGSSAGGATGGIAGGAATSNAGGLIGCITGIGQAASGCLIPLVLIPLYCMHFFGAGDIKLLMASGACLGVSASMHTLLWTLLIEGAIGFLVLCWHRGVNKKTTFLRFPMAPFHAVGVVLTLFGPRLLFF